MKIQKIADIVDGTIVLTEKRRSLVAEINDLITSLEPAADPNETESWKLEVQIGEGSAARIIAIDLPPFVGVDDSLDQPLLLGPFPIVLFRNRLFVPERQARNATEREEIVLRVRKYMYDEDAELSGLRAAVANIDAAIQFSRTAPRREPIPEDVKLVVWARDGGACIRCGSRQSLHFDHVIPVVKGGGNTEANIQLLCQTCNLKKADRIAF